jgi:VIT1/CCC1 family predicted Fe2+/Mn2+ transporter
VKKHPQEVSHYTDRVGWLRAAVLGANDGIVSIASLILGVAATRESKSAILVAGIAGLVAGAMSMAAGEYVSVQSQADAEKADLERERNELKTDKEGELRELAQIYVDRGLEPKLARQVAEQMSAHDALSAHARDELGLSENLVARPFQAAITSALSFAAGASLPLTVGVLCPMALLLPVLSGGSLVFLAGLGALAAKMGGAPMLKAAFRVTFWGAIAMGLTALVGRFVGPAV